MIKLSTSNHESPFVRLALLHRRLEHLQHLDLRFTLSLPQTISQVGVGHQTQHSVEQKQRTNTVTMHQVVSRYRHHQVHHSFCHDDGSDVGH